MFYKVFRAVCSVILRFYYSIDIMCESSEADFEGGAIVCANHSTNLDPVLVGITVPKQVHFMAKKELFEGRIRNYFMNILGAFPVSRGENDIKSMKTAIRVVKEGGVLGLFPEGTRNTTGEELEAKAGVGFIVAKTGRPVIPITIRSGVKFRSKVSITVGKAMSFSEYEGRKLTGEDYRAISGLIMSKIREN
ncbi:MAG: 1-acyl-sn-glycerol-3-phosphate acyltransferase [Clostridia bacterium]|nr:1-acyl-sn-glycerol-3-phosphate acyltransferase [Clostridia bacterium]